MTLTYTASASDQQPYGSYRIDVYSQKAGRRMTLYGKPALCQFIDLEANVEVSTVCERPLLIPNSKPRQMVDFWAICGGVATFYILKRPSDVEVTGTETSAFSQFCRWAEDNKAHVKIVNIADFETNRIRYDNWSSILQHLIAHRGQVTDHLVNRCEKAILQTATLQDIENDIADLDAMLVRAAVFTLLARGHLKCDSIDKIQLNYFTKVVKV